MAFTGRKKINGSLTLLIDKDCTRITVEDKDACTTILYIELTPDQLCAVLSRQACVHCDVRVGELSRVGKKHENKTLKFPMPPEVRYDRAEMIKVAKEQCAKYIPEGWVADNYYNSQHSFITEDNQQYAQVTIRRWIDKESSDDS